MFWTRRGRSGDRGTTLFGSDRRTGTTHALAGGLAGLAIVLAAIATVDAASAQSCPNNETFVTDLGCQCLVVSPYNGQCCPSNSTPQPDGSCTPEPCPDAEVLGPDGKTCVCGPGAVTAASLGLTGPGCICPPPLNPWNTLCNMCSSVLPPGADDPRNCCPQGDVRYNGQCVPGCPAGQVPSPNGSCCPPSNVVVNNSCVCNPDQLTPGGTCCPPNTIVLNGQCAGPCPPYEAPFATNGTWQCGAPNCQQTGFAANAMGQCVPVQCPQGPDWAANSTGTCYPTNCAAGEVATTGGCQQLGGGGIICPPNDPKCVSHPPPPPPPSNGCPTGWVQTPDGQCALVCPPSEMIEGRCRSGGKSPGPMPPPGPTPTPPPGPMPAPLRQPPPQAAQPICFPGYALAADGKSCERIGATPQPPPAGTTTPQPAPPPSEPCPNGQSRNAEGTCGLAPVCPSGFVLGADGVCQRVPPQEHPCPPGQVPGPNGTCVQSCPNGEAVNADGMCVKIPPPSIVCPVGEESVDSRCVKIPTPPPPPPSSCPPGEIRNVNGSCGRPPTPPPRCPAGEERNADGACMPARPTSCPAGETMGPNGCVKPSEPAPCPAGEERTDRGCERVETPPPPPRTKIETPPKVETPPPPKRVTPQKPPPPKLNFPLKPPVNEKENNR